MTHLPAPTEEATPGLIIRSAAEADLPRIVELLSQLALGDNRDVPADPLPDTYHTALRDIDADPRQQLMVAELEGQVVGSIVVGIIPNLSHRGRPWAFVESVVVDDWARGRGYGEALVRYAIEEARRVGCYKLSLTSNKRRSEAHRFYKKLGFTATHEGFRLTF